MASPTSSAGLVSTGTILDRIVARKLEELAAIQLIPDVEPPPIRDFGAALRRADGHIALIAEIKHASPSKGVLIEPFDPVGLAKTYAQGGAAAISVLTDHDFFGGSLADLQAARAEVAIPVLRKDFTIDGRQIQQAQQAGADAILLIVAILDDAKLRDLHVTARDLGLAVLVEVHTEAEMERALKINPHIVGINNRDLHTFHVDLAVFHRLARLCPPSITLVAESGIFTLRDVEAVSEAGAHAILVGESIVKAADVASQVRMLSSVSTRAKGEAHS